MKKAVLHLFGFKDEVRDFFEEIRTENLTAIQNRAKGKFFDINVKDHEGKTALIHAIDV